MTYGMEGRTPLIDKELFAKFFYLEDKIKQKNGYGKYLIRNFLKKKLRIMIHFQKRRIYFAY